MFKSNTLEFNRVNTAHYGRGFKQEFVEYVGKNCYFPTSVNCFIECINHLTCKDYTEEFSTFIRTEQRKSNVMTSARIPPFCKKHKFNVGYYEGFRVCPRNITQKKITLKLHKNPFCLI